MRRSKLFDRSGKVLVRVALPALLRLAGVRSAGKAVRLRDVTVNLPQYQADSVIEIGEEDDPARWVLQVELVYEPDSRALRGWFLKNAALNAQFHVPVVLVAIYLRRGRRATFPDRLVIGSGENTNEFRFRAVRLWEHRERITAGDLRLLAPLLLLCDNQPTEETLQEERRLILGAAVSPELRTDLLALAVMVGSAFFSRDLLRKLFQEELKMARGTTLIDEWVEERAAELAVEARREDLLDLVREKFGDLPEDLRGRIRTISDSAALTRLLRQVVHATSLGELDLP